MDQFNDFTHLGDDIMDTVTKAVGENNFQGLNDSIQSVLRQYTQNFGNTQNAGVNFKVNPSSPEYNPGAADSGYSQNRAENKADDGRNIYPGSGTSFRPSAGNTAGNRNFSRSKSHTSYTYTNAQGRTYRESQSGSYTSYNNGRNGNAYGQGREYRPPRGARKNPNAGYAAGNNRTAGSYGNSPFLVRKPSYTGSVLQIVFGAIGLAFNGFLFLALLLAFFITSDAVLNVSFFFLAISVGFGILLRKGMIDKKLLNEFYLYGRFLGNSEFSRVDELASKVGEIPELVLENLQKMIRKEYLPQARFDKEHTTLMLTERAYDQYLQAEKGRSEREAEQAEKEAKIRREEEGLPENVRAILREGERYIEDVHYCNDLIPGEEMSRKLDDLEQIVRQIFAQLKQHPEQADDLRKFLNYYLPTTEKLLHAYIDLDNQPASGENIETARKEIEDVIDTINSAFRTLLDNLFQQMAWDVSTDISVMKSMMSQDGLDAGESTNTQNQNENKDLQ